MRVLNDFTTTEENKASMVIWIIGLFALLFFIPIIISLSANAVDVAPAPPSIGSDVPLTYFGPSPSTVQPELIGPYQLLKAGNVDLNAGTITIPLYQGQVRMHDGTANTQKVWYILTDTDDKGNANALGLNWSPKLTFSPVGARNATVEKNTTLTFDGGTVDFKPKHVLTPGNTPNAFPPKAIQAGSIGSGDYSPLVRIVNAGNHIYNAPVVASNVDETTLNAFCNGNPDNSIMHDKVVKICPKDHTVTLKLTSGFSFARPVLYLSMDSNNQIAAAMENATLTPRLSFIQTGHDDSAFSAVERIFGIINGPTGKDNPQRQGFNSALSEGLMPLNVVGGIPTIALDYSPIWDLNLGQWTQKAIDNGYRSKVLDEFTILGLAAKGWITGPMGSPFGSSGIVINCPIVYRFL